jgi:hypothetical protein
MFQLLNQLTSSYEMYCERYDIKGNLSIVVVSFLQLLETWRTHELKVGAVLASFHLRFWNDVGPVVLDFSTIELKKNIQLLLR